MKSSLRFALTGLATAAILTGCSSGGKDAKGETDPAMTGALEDQIMVDPELAGQNGGAASAGSARVDLPPEQRSPEAIAAAKQEAGKIAGTMQTAPQPASGNIASLVEQAATAAQVAESSRAASTDCSSKAKYSMNWASMMPTALQVYPRGAVQEAAGTDNDGCRLRVVSFVTPVAASDVVNFYYTQVSNAGYDAQYRMDGSDHVLGGNKSGSAYLVYARKLDNGLTEVDLIASGQ